VTLQLGEPIARGGRSTVYAWGDDAVAKVPMPDTPDAWIRTEAGYTAAVYDAGAPVPEFLGFEENEGRTISIYRRANGVLMLDSLLGDLDRVVEYAHLLAELQVRFASLVPPIVLPDQLDRLRSKIRVAAQRVDESFEAALDAVPPVTRVAVCHGDLHPANVILTDDGPVVVDWFDASRGDPVADVARSTILLAQADELDHPDPDIHALVTRFVDAYVDAAANAFGFDEGTLAQWRAVVAVARIAEGMPVDPLRDVWLQWVSNTTR